MKVDIACRVTEHTLRCALKRVLDLSMTKKKQQKQGRPGNIYHVDDAEQRKNGGGLGARLHLPLAKAIGAHDQ